MTTHNPPKSRDKCFIIFMAIPNNTLANAKFASNRLTGDAPYIYFLISKINRANYHP